MADELLAYLSSAFDDDDAIAVRDLASDLGNGHGWHFEPPYFIDEGDDAIRTVGLVLPLSLNGKDQDVPVTDLTVLIKGLARLSFSHQVEITLELDDRFVGEIRDGDPDGGIRQGLLATWEHDEEAEKEGAVAGFQLVLQWPPSRWSAWRVLLPEVAYGWLLLVSPIHWCA